MKDLTYILQDEDYIKEATKFTRKNFIKQNRKLIAEYQQGKNPKPTLSTWKELKPILYEKQNGRCAICECKMYQRRSIDVEHFRPKAHYWWLAYNFKNYYIACAECNSTNKGEKFPIYKNIPRNNYEKRKNKEPILLINPYLENPYDYFIVVFGVHSASKKRVLMLEPRPPKKQTPISDIEQFKNRKAIKTIEVFNLNLNKYDSRKHYSQLEMFIDFYNQLYLLADKVLIAKKSKSQDALISLKNYWNRLKTEKSPIIHMGYTQLILKGYVDIRH